MIDKNVEYAYNEFKKVQSLSINYFYKKYYNSNLLSSKKKFTEKVFVYLYNLFVH